MALRSIFKISFISNVEYSLKNIISPQQNYNINCIKNQTFNIFFSVYLPENIMYNELEVISMKNIIYQMFLRSATRGGTIKAGAKLLRHIASLGVDVVYLCPIFEADDDENTEHWSKRQRESGLNNPQNPYRMKDYFKIDEEYGTDDDLKSFVNTAHSYGLKVILDLVYYHCGPCARLMD